MRTRGRVRTVGRFAALLPGVTALLATGWSTAHAQIDDLPKLLTGRWDGAIQGSPRGDRYRRLVITAVEKQDGTLVATMRFGFPQSLSKPFTIPLAVNGADVSLEFTTPRGGEKVSLKLEGRTVLRGTLKFTQGNVQRPWDLRLEKTSDQ